MAFVPGVMLHVKGHLGLRTCTSKDGDIKQTADSLMLPVALGCDGPNSVICQQFSPSPPPPSKQLTETSQKRRCNIRYHLCCSSGFNPNCSQANHGTKKKI